MKNISNEKASKLLSQIQIIKAYATCVETELKSFLGGVGTAQEGQIRKKKIDTEAIRRRARKQFLK